MFNTSTFACAAFGEPLDARHEVGCARHHTEHERIIDDRQAADAFRFDTRTVDVVEPERIRRGVADGQRAAHAQADVGIGDGVGERHVIVITRSMIEANRWSGF
jgi:hypothetical protein